MQYFQYGEDFPQNSHPYTLFRGRSAILRSVVKTLALVAISTLLSLMIAQLH